MADEPAIEIAPHASVNRRPEHVTKPMDGRVHASEALDRPLKPFFRRAQNSDRFGPAPEGRSKTKRPAFHRAQALLVESANTTAYLSYQQSYYQQNAD
jgi:hypothetical protein